MLLLKKDSYIMLVWRRTIVLIFFSNFAEFLDLYSSFPPLLGISLIYFVYLDCALCFLLRLIEIRLCLLRQDDFN
jgi:hypothetical protein